MINGILPEVGNIVLVRITGPSEEAEYRPLLVLRVIDDKTVRGRLFLDWDHDRRGTWMTRLAKYVEDGMAVITSTRGDGLGEFRMSHAGIQKGKE